MITSTYATSVIFDPVSSSPAGDPLTPDGGRLVNGGRLATVRPASRDAASLTGSGW